MSSKGDVERVMSLAEHYFNLYDLESAIKFAVAAREMAKEMDLTVQRTIQTYITAYNTISAAEQCFQLNDVKNAIKFAMRAKKMSTRHQDIIDNYITAYSVHTAARTNSPWAVLAMNGQHLPKQNSVAFETIKKQYMKMIQILNPQFNKSVAAYGAFKLVYKAMVALGEYYKPDLDQWRPSFWSELGSGRGYRSDGRYVVPCQSCDEVRKKLSEENPSGTCAVCHFTHLFVNFSC